MLEIIVCLIAGLGAGIGTGLAGLSAAAVISPMLITFLNFDPYAAVGIALASDVLASAASAVTYARNKKIDIKNGIVMLITVLIMTAVGSYIASLLPSVAIGGFSVAMTFLLGVKFIVKPVMTVTNKVDSKDRKTAIIQSILCGVMVGFICGFIGAGGGMMMLLVLTSVLGYELKTAVGTSVFIMSFTALTGAGSHFIIAGEMPDLKILILCVLFTLIGAVVSAKFANIASTKTLNRATGIVLAILGAIMIVVKYFL